MHAIMICLAAAAAGIDAGWQRMPEGGMEYIIQLDPQTLDILRAGDAVQSDIPPAAGEIRSYRIVVGTKELPHDDPPPTDKRGDAKDLTANKESRSAPPQPLPSEPAQKLPPARPAIFEHSIADAPATPQSTAAAPPPAAPSTPWLPLTATILGLLASLSANVYLVWIAWDARRQWRTARHAVN